LKTHTIMKILLIAGSVINISILMSMTVCKNIFFLLCMSVLISTYMIIDLVKHVVVNMLIGKCIYSKT